jgi:Tol biopolymer transport system component
MSDLRSIVDRELERVELRPFTLESFHRRRERKRRNERITAGIVGIAIGAAILLAGISITRAEHSPATPSPTALRHNGDIAVETGRGVQAIDPSTGRSRVVLKDPSVQAADWSPDGTELAYIVKRPSGSLALRIWNERTGGSERIYSCSLPCGSFFAAVDWAPDGSRLAFQFGSGRLYVIGVDGSHLMKLSDAAAARDPSWSPVGDQIAFSTDQGIFVVGADGSRPTYLTAGAYPAWSPDGTTIAFVRHLSESTANPAAPFVAQIWVIRPDGSGINKVFELPGCCNRGGIGPAWSPDGRKLAFVFAHGFPRLYVMDADGSDVQVLGHTSVRGHVWPVRPSWQSVP